MSSSQRYDKHFTLEMCNRPLSTLAETESVLIDKCQRALDDGTIKDPIEKLRFLCLARGASGFSALGRAFRRLDHDGKRHISLKQFTKGLRDAGMDVSDEDAKEIFKRFDTDGRGTINMSEFLNKIRPPMSQRRLNIIGEAFRKLDKEGYGHITIKDLKHVYSVQHDPMYTSGELTEEQILNRFLADFEEGSSINDGKVTQEEFESYYAGVSASMDDDAFFDLVMRQLYNL